jgi:hypothetical protein
MHAHTQIMEIKAGSSVIQRIWVMGAFARTYEAGVHWYTNDLNLWQPEFNRIGACSTKRDHDSTTAYSVMCL